MAFVFAGKHEACAPLIGFCDVVTNRLGSVLFVPALPQISHSPLITSSLLLHTITMNAVAVFARTGIRARATMGATPMRSGAYHWTNDSGKVRTDLNPTEAERAFRYQEKKDSE